MKGEIKSLVLDHRVSKQQNGDVNDSSLILGSVLLTSASPKEVLFAPPSSPPINVSDCNLPSTF